MLHQPHGARGITVVGLPQAFGLQSRLLVLVGPVGFLRRGRAGRARVGLLLAEVCVDATGFHVFRGDGVDATAATLSRGRAVRAPAVVFQTLLDAPSGWTCSSSALRFRVDTAGPVSSLTMAPRSPAGGFACLARHEGGWGFPQPFCNERSVSGPCVCREHRCAAVFTAHWVFECCGRARATAKMLLVAKRLRALDMHQKIIAGARRPCKTFCIFTFRKGRVRFCLASFVDRLSDAALLRTPRAAAAQVRTPASFLKP